MNYIIAVMTLLLACTSGYSAQFENAIGVEIEKVDLVSTTAASATLDVRYSMARPSADGIYFIAAQSITENGFIGSNSYRPSRLMLERKPLPDVKAAFCEIDPSRQVTTFGTSVGQYLGRDIPEWYKTDLPPKFRLPRVT